MDAARCILIGNGHTIAQLTRQLALVGDPPRQIGCVLLELDSEPVQAPILGRVGELEAIVERYRPDTALISLPAAMNDLITNVRTTLRRLGVADRFLATIEDQVAGVGPRTQFTVDAPQLIGRKAHELDEALIRATIAGKRIMITGAGGSIGSELACQCARYEPAALLLMERSENSLFEIDRRIARFWPNLKRKALLHDVADAQRTLALCRAVQPHVVFHAAAHKHVPMMEDHPAHAVDNNVFGTKAIVDAAREAGADRIVMISTDKAVNPVSVMGATKRLAELYVQHVSRGITEAGLDGSVLRIVRFGNVLGSACSVLPIWGKQIAEGGPITITHPEMTRYFMTIPEAASLVIQAASFPPDPTSPAGGEVFILDMGEPIRILDLAERFIRAHGLEPVIGDDCPTGRSGLRVVITGPRPGEKLHEELAHEAEKTARTPHPAIRVWHGEPPSVSDIERMIADLNAVRRCDDHRQVLDVIRRYSPKLGVALQVAQPSEAFAA
ncbi:MAG: polysaccharide biosynthesis protein [Phycisphaerales bacterium]|nr:polysaccharide biosynthesis protein [Phycisphaerales bacterium]